MSDKKNQQQHVDSRLERLSPSQIALEYNIRPETVVSWIKRGWLAAEPLPRGYRVTREALNEFLAHKPWEA